MKSMKSISGYFAVISLLLGVIWLTPVSAAVPAFSSLGQITSEALQVPGAMDIDEAGNLYVVDVYAGGKVHKFDTYGKLTQSFDVGASGTGLAVKPGSPGEPSGLIYVALDQSVVIFDVNAGAVVGEFVNAGSATMDVDAGAIDVGANGNVFVVDASLMSVNVYDADGVYLNSFGGVGPDPGQFMQIGGMAVNPSGQVVVADSSYGNGKIQVFTLNPDLSVSAVATYDKGSAQSFGTPIMHAPRGIAFDDQGRGFFLDFMSSQVRVTDAGFSYLGAYTAKGYDVGQLNNVIDAVYDTDNDRLFVGCDTGRIEVFGIDGGSNPVYVNHAPSVPQPKSPVAGSEVDSLTPALVINNATDADGDALTYRVVLSRGETVIDEIVAPAAAGETTSVDVGVVLAENVAYSWTVQASDGEKSSAVSTAANFVVNATEEAPDAPELDPLFAGGSVDGQAVFAWTEVVDPDPNDNVKDYLLQVSADVDFASVVTSEEVVGNSLQLSDFADYASLVDGDSYYWRVTARVDSEESSAPSAVDSFVYDTTMLTVTANVPGAEVSLHGNHAFAGQFLSLAPFSVRDFLPGTMSVVVERAGFEPFVAQVSLTEGDNVDLYAELVPAMVVDKLKARRNGVNGRSGLDVGADAAPFLVDFDNDGDLDLLVGDNSGTLTLHKNMQMVGRDRLYFDQGEVLVGVTGAVPFVADWNDDGRKDLIVGRIGGAVKLYKNIGSEVAPAFDAGTDLILPLASNAAPAVIDHDGDEFKDLLVGDASGRVTLYRGGATGLAEGVALDIPAAGSAVVPMPVDWDADGRQDLLISADGMVTVYTQVDGEYQAAAQFEGRRNDYKAAFPIDLDGSGKQMLVGQADGQIVYLSGKSKDPVASFLAALQDKADELVDLVAIDAPEFNNDAVAIAVMIAAGDHKEAKHSAGLLAGVLPAGDAQNSARELFDIL